MRSVRVQVINPGYRNLKPYTSQHFKRVTMINGKLELKTPDEAESVYYEAFEHGDSQVMSALWSQGDVVCVHPGSGAILGHTAVMRSWHHIFSNAQKPEIKFSVVKRTHADGLAVHLVAEEISSEDVATVVVLATNVYQRGDSGWLMIEHHASLVTAPHKNHTLQ